MTETLNLTFASTAELDVDTRVFSGTAVPYGVTTQDGRNVRFAQGAFGDLNSQSLTAVLVQHPFTSGKKAVHVGRVESWTDGETALSFSARLNETEDAEAIYQALKAGDITDVSVGVYVSEFSEDEDGVTTFASASLLELSLITEGSAAFADSKILVVHSGQPDEAPASPTKETNTMETNLDTQVADLAGDVEALNRQLAAFADAAPVTSTVSQFPTFGAVVKAVANGDETAIAEITDFAYTGGVSADTNIKHAWAQPLIKIVDQGRPLLSLFDKLPDPESNVIEYLKLDTNTISVAEQAAEGDDLSYGKLDLTSATANMKTYGGWTDFSHQQLKRSDVGVIDLGYRALASKYAQVTEAALRVTFLSASATAVTGFNPATYSTVIDTVVEAQTIMDDRGHQIEFIVASPDVFKALAKANTGTANDFVLSRDNGSVDVRGISATLFGIPVKVIPGTGVFTFTNSHALTVWESGVGRLSDDNIVNLTSAFSLYGYMGHAVTDNTAIVKATA